MSASAPLTFEELCKLKSIGDAQMSPDGQRVAYVLAESALGVGEPSSRSSIWVVGVDGGEPCQVSEGATTDRSPRWSPDGSRLAFRSDREKRGRAQVYLLPPGTGESRRLTDFGGGVSDFEWAPDGKSIVVVASDPNPERDEGDDRILYEDEARYGRLWIVDVETGAARRVTTADEQIWEFCWAPDGSAIAAITSETPHRWDWYRARLSRIDVASGEITMLHQPERQLARPVWSPDGKWIAVTTSIWSDPGMTGGDVLLVAADGSEVRHLGGNDARSHLTVHWEPGGRSLLTGTMERGTAAVCQVTLDGSAETLWREEKNLGSYGVTVSRDTSMVAAVIVAFNQPAEIWVGRAGADVDWRQLTHHNDEFVDRLPGTIESRSWTTADGEEIQGWLVWPNSVQKGTAVPMVTIIHGGPTGTSPNSYPERGTSMWVPELLRRGVAVFFPNARGSAGWGLNFAEANQRDMGGADLQDILAGVDDCVRNGIADPERLGVCGWSYGGYLTAWAVTQTDRFKAAIAGASITNWVSFHGTSDIPAFDEFFYRSSPYEMDGPYIKFSPIYSADRVTTPTMFLHGERDLICPVSQAMEMFRVLRNRGVPTECVIYPREGHPIREDAHRRDMYHRGIDWLCRWMGVEAD